MYLTTYKLLSSKYSADDIPYLFGYWLLIYNWSILRLLFLDSRLSEASLIDLYCKNTAQLNTVEAYPLALYPIGTHFALCNFTQLNFQISGFDNDLDYIF